eukprot:4870806-Pyramimonas_sp.AAC.1
MATRGAPGQQALRSRRRQKTCPADPGAPGPKAPARPRGWGPCLRRGPAPCRPCPCAWCGRCRAPRSRTAPGS